MKAKALVEKKMAIDEFAQLNRKDLERMAGYILKRWPAPNDYGVEDVVQDLLFECWRKKNKFDPTRGKTAEQYISFNAISYAKRQVHRARRARGDRGIGRFELLGTGDDSRYESDEDSHGYVGTACRVEFELERRDNLRDLIERCSSAREAICLLVFYEEEDTKAAGDRIYKDAQLRDICSVRCAEEAREAVKQVAKEHAWLG